MAAIAHASAEQTTEQTTASTSFVDVTGASIGSGNFVTGKKYLIVVWALQRSHSSTQQAKVRLVHDSTVFAGSEQVLEPVLANNRYVYNFFIVWTAVSGEGVKLQFASSFSANTAGVDQVVMFAMNLSDDLTEDTDWFYSEDNVSRTLTDAFTTGATITFTPGAAGDDWLVVTRGRYDPNSLTESSQGRMQRSGEASSTTPVFRADSEDAMVDRLLSVLSRTFNLGAASNTFDEQFKRASGSGGSRTHGAVFAFNLNKFNNHAFFYSDAGILVGTPDFGTEVATVSLTPSIIGDVWAFFTCANNVNADNTSVKSRLQVDNVDQPPTQTDDNYLTQESRGSAERDSLLMQTLEVDMAASAHNFDIDGSSESTATDFEGRSLFAITMELAAVVFDAALMAAMDRPRPDIVFSKPEVVASGMTPPSHQEV